MEDDLTSTDTSTNTESTNIDMDANTTTSDTTSMEDVTDIDMDSCTAFVMRFVASTDRIVITGEDAVTDDSCSRPTLQRQRHCSRWESS